MTVATGAVVEPPYLGLRYFDEEHAHLFFGRDEQVTDILQKLLRSRLVTIMGGSGSGKSSLVRAGLLRSLKSGLLGDVGPDWRIAKVRPGSYPIASLARELEHALSASGLEVTLRRGPLGLVQTVAESRLSVGENVLVVVDQFEEIFRYQRESNRPDQTRAEAVAFVKLLLEATSQRDHPVYVVLTMRSDYLGNCAQFRDLPERINDGLYLVPRLRREQLEQAIVGPAAVEDAEIAPRLAQRLLNETGDDPDQLPVLQHALLRTWIAWNRAARPIDLEDLEAIGGMSDSLGRHAEEVYASLTAVEQAIARVMFQQLSERDAEGREIRRPAPIGQVAAVAGTSVETLDAIVWRFADASLVYRNEDGDLDITHESLIRKWRRLHGWMEEEVLARDQFLSLAERTAKQDVLIGPALEEGLQWRALRLNDAWARRYLGPPATVMPEEVQRFIDECRAKQIAQRRSRRVQLGATLLLLVAALVAISVLWVRAERQKAIAVRMAADAKSATGRAERQAAQLSTLEAARLISEGRPALALPYLARTLASTADDVAARSWLTDVLLRGHLWMPGPAPRNRFRRIRAVVFGADGRVMVVADGSMHVFNPTLGEPLVSVRTDDSPLPASFSASGRWLVTHDLLVGQVWDVAAGKPVGPQIRSDEALIAARLSADGRSVVTTAFRGKTLVRDVLSGKITNTLDVERVQPTALAFCNNGWIVQGAGERTMVWSGNTLVRTLDTGKVTYLACSQDSRAIVIASGWSVEVWDIARGQRVGGSFTHGGTVRVVAFSPDGKRVVSGADDRTAGVWDIEGRRLIGLLQHLSSVEHVAFSPDGRAILTGGADRVQLWYAPEETAPDPVLEPAMAAPPGQVSEVDTVALSSDGRKIATATEDGTARLWDTFAHRAIGKTMRHAGRVNSMAFSDDGRRLVTSTGLSARVWDAATGQPITSELEVRSPQQPTFSPTGQRLLTASEDEARLWDLADQTRSPTRLQSHAPVTSAAFSPDGHRLAIGSEDNTLTIWDALTGEILASGQVSGSVFSIAFSPDGQRIVTGSEQSAVIWDASERQRLSRVRELPHPSAVTFVAFSQDGRRILTVSRDNSARVWDTDTGRPTNPLQHQSMISSARFSPDAKRVVTAAVGSVGLWNAATGQPISRLLEHPSAVHIAVFSPDGSSVVTAAYDGIARVWKVLFPLDSSKGAGLLADLAEVASGLRLTDAGTMVSLEESERLERLRRLMGSETKGAVPLDVVLRRFFPDYR